MNFINAEDYDLLQLLLNDQVVAMSEFQLWEKPEEGHLMDIAIANHKNTNEKQWITALVKHCRITRFNNPKVDPVIFSQLSLDLPSIKAMFAKYVYPITIVDQALWLGVLRLDVKLDELREMFSGFDDIFFCAICPREAGELIKVYKKYAKQELKTTELETAAKNSYEIKAQYLENMNT